MLILVQSHSGVCVLRCSEIEILKSRPPCSAVENKNFLTLELCSKWVESTPVPLVAVSKESFNHWKKLKMFQI